jgi:hypothetical protein
MKSAPVAAVVAVLAAVASPTALAQRADCDAPRPEVFRTLDGRIYAPDGREFIPRGINIRPEDLDSVARSATTLFPGINFIRLAIDDGTYPTPAHLLPFVSQMTAKHIVVEIEDHPWPSPGTYSGAKLAAESGWYQSLARAFKDNPYVWFGTMNEPSVVPYGPPEAAITDQEVATYKAIRGTGSQAIIMMELDGGGNPGSVGADFGMTASAYAEMINIVWDLHFYGWSSKFNTDQAAVTASLQGSASKGIGIAAAQSITSAGGETVPVVIGEFGDSTDGTKRDPNADQVVNAVRSGGYGFAAWAWGSGSDADQLTKNGLLTAFGRQVAAAIAAGSHWDNRGSPPGHTLPEVASCDHGRSAD